MDWSNENVLEFLELYKVETCIWNPRNKYYRYRKYHIDAWRRIQQALSFDTTVEELKRKKDSLMACYRSHIYKIKKMKLRSDSDDTYTITWFAFDLMNSFLKPIYDKDSTFTTEFVHYSDHTEEPLINAPFQASETSSGNDSDIASERAKNSVHCKKEIDTTAEQTIERTSSNEGSSTNRAEKRSFPRAYVSSFIKKPRLAPRLAAVRKRVLDTHYKKITERKDTDDEYDCFGKLIATKIRNMDDPDEREILMHSIHDFVFQYIMKNRRLRSQQ